MITAENVKTIPRIFLSFAAADRPLALRVQNLLSQRMELRIFRDDALSAGEDWTTRLKNEIEECDFFISFLTPSSVDSSWILSELGAAWGLRKRMILFVSHREILRLLSLDYNKKEALVITIDEIGKPETLDTLLSLLKETLF